MQWPLYHGIGDAHWSKSKMLLLVWFISLLVYLHDQTGYATNNMYHVESSVDEPPWVTAAAGSCCW